MKRNYLPLLLCFTLSAGYSQVITKLHNGVSTFYYDVDDLSNIVINASDNDTIILPGGPIDCSGITVNKPLTFIGAGASNPGTPVTDPTIIVYANQLDIVIPAAGSGSSFHGISFWRKVRFTSNATNVSMVRCAFSSFSLAGNQQTPPSNLRIKHCVFFDGIGSAGSSAPQGLVVENSIIEGGVVLSGGVSTATITQCVLLNMTTNNNANPGVTFTNNIFTRSSSSYSLNSNSTYAHNLFAISGGNTLNWTNAVDGGNNIAVQATLSNVFVNLGPFTAFNQFYDYHLTATSPARNMGQNGYDVGIYDGPIGSSWKEGMIPFNPHWVELLPSGTLGTTTGGTINVNFTGAAQEN